MFKLNSSLKTLLLAISLLAIGLSAKAQEELNMFADGGFSSLRYSYFSIGGLTADQIDKGGASFSNYNYIGINYKLDSDRRLALRIPFYFNTAGFDKYGKSVEQNIELADVVLAATFYDLGYWGYVDFRGTAKLGLPTSQYSQINKMIAFISMDFFADYTPLRYTTLTYLAKPRFYFQSQKAFFDSSTPLRADGSYEGRPIRANKMADLEHTLQIKRDLNSTVALTARAGFDETWYYGSIAEGISESHVTSGIAGIGGEFRVSRTWLVKVSVENKPRLTPYRNRTTGQVMEEVAFFRPKDNTYNLQLNGTLF